MEHLLQLIAENPEQFSDDFIEWLPANEHIWDAFVAEAMKVRARGRTHYSSYTIVEFLRHHSMVQEVGGMWKINNNHRPYLPRLFDLRFPHMAGMFEYRTLTKPKRGRFEEDNGFIY
jgi:hypothetical protein